MNALFAMVPQRTLCEHKSKLSSLAFYLRATPFPLDMEAAAHIFYILQCPTNIISTKKIPSNNNDECRHCKKNDFSVGRAECGYYTWNKEK